MENLILQTAFLGDLILAIPLMRELALTYPDDRLAVVCRKGLGGLIRGLKFVDRVIEVDKKNAKLWRHQSDDLKREKFRVLLCPHRSPRTAFWVRSLQAEKKVGFHLWWNSLFFDERVEQPLYLPDALRQLSLLTSVSERFADQYSEVASIPKIENSSDKTNFVDFRLSYAPAWSQLRFGDLKPVELESPLAKSILIAPGSTWPTKQWTKNGFIELARLLLEKGESVAIVGSPEERSLAEEIGSAAPGAKVFAGQWPLLETVHHYHQAKAMVANDSGAIHMAALAELPTVAIFGPTTLALGFRPWQSQSVVVQRNLSCRPCGRHGHKVCPINTHACMVEISAQQVFEGLQTFLGPVTSSRE